MYDRFPRLSVPNSVGPSRSFWQNSFNIFNSALYQKSAATVLETEEGEAPHVAQADGVAEAGDEEVARVPPATTLGTRRRPRRHRRFFLSLGKDGAVSRQVPKHLRRVKNERGSVLERPRRYLCCLLDCLELDEEEWPSCHASSSCPHGQQPPQPHRPQARCTLGPLPQQSGCHSVSKNNIAASNVPPFECYVARPRPISSE